MAILQPSTSDSYTAKSWAFSKDLLAESIRETNWHRLLGTTDEYAVRVLKNLQKSKGDTINYQLRAKQTTRGVTEGQALVGNEGKLTFYNDSIAINQYRDGVRVPGEGSIFNQRTQFTQYDDAKNALKTLVTERLDYWFFNHICANTVQTDTIYTGFNSVTAIDSSHIVRQGSASNDQSLGSGDTMTLTFIDKLVTTARTVSNPLRPIKVNGNDMYVLFIHDYQEYSLRTATSGITWYDANKALITGGDKNNGIFTGALGHYNNVVIHRSDKLSLGVNSSTGAAVTSTRRAVLMGAGAMTFALGNATEGSDFSDEKLPLKFSEETFDYDEEIGVAFRLVGGMKAAVFNSTYNGLVIGTTYAAAP